MTHGRVPVSQNGMTQLRIAETDEIRPCHLLLQRRRGGSIRGRGPHAHPLARRSATYDLKPEMSAYEV